MAKSDGERIMEMLEEVFKSGSGVEKAGLKLIESLEREKNEKLIEGMKMLLKAQKDVSEQHAKLNRAFEDLIEILEK